MKHVFAGTRSQRGRAVGAWLGGLIRHILPYVTSGAKAVGKEAVRAGMHVIYEDMQIQRVSLNCQSVVQRYSRSIRRITYHSSVSQFWAREMQRIYTGGKNI